MKEKSYFYIAGFISFSIYFIICFFFIIFVNSAKPKEFDSFNKTTVLELELITQKADDRTIAKKSKEKQKIIKKSTSKSNKKVADFKSLFAKVKTKSSKIVEKDVNPVKSSIDPSRYKSKFQKLKKSDNHSIPKLLNDVKTATNLQKTTSTAKGKTHKYYSRIKEILWSRWNPRFLEDGLKVQVLVTITKYGKFDYKILKYSNNERFNESLKKFLDSQKEEVFPPQNIKSKLDIVIDFKSEG